jgi:hypothetical protein
VRLLQLVLFGPRVAVALPDCRSQRTEDQVLSFDTHMSLIIKIEVRMVGDRGDGTGVKQPRG